jgi:hypothetical protein
MSISWEIRKVQNNPVRESKQLLEEGKTSKLNNFIPKSKNNYSNNRIL